MKSLVFAGKVMLPVLAGILVWSGFVVYRIAQVERSAKPRQADVAIVLGAAVWGEQPSPGLRERLEKALWLYREGYVPYLIVSGGVGPGKPISEAEAMRRWLEEQGIPGERILMEDRARSTYENLAFSRAIMERHGFRTALVVSHGYHLARAVEMARSLGMQVHPVAVETQVLFVPYHTGREVLAYTKWKMEQLLAL